MRKAESELPREQRLALKKQRKEAAEESKKKIEELEK